MAAYHRCHMLKAVSKPLCISCLCTDVTSCRQSADPLGSPCLEAQHRSQVHLAAASADHDALSRAVRIQQDMVGCRVEHASALLDGVQ